MNDLLFYALLMALLYYFFIYLPSQKKLSSRPSNQPSSSPLPIFDTKQTQTEEILTEITRIEEPGSTDILNGPGAIQFPGNQFVEDPQVIQQLKEEKSELEKANRQKEQTIISLNNSYDKLANQKKQELDNLKKQLSEKEEKIKELTEVEKSLEEMINSIKELNEEIK